MCEKYFEPFLPTIPANNELLRQHDGYRKEYCAGWDASKEYLFYYFP